MQEDQNRLTPSPNEQRPRRRPPYGLPPRDRLRPGAAPDSLGWRRYSTPIPPDRPPARDRPRLARPALLAGLLGCVAFSIWSSSWGRDDAASRSSAASTAIPTPSTARRSVASSSSASPSPRALSSTTPTPIPKVSKRKAQSPKPHRRPALPAVPLQRHRTGPLAPPVKTVVPAERTKRSPNNEPRARDRGPETLEGIATCDELFPPSQPEFRIRNRACHMIYG
jgi:hypothetical protein